MPATLQVESTLTDRYQTTVPETVRRALRLGKRDKIHYTIRPDGEVVLSRAAVDSGDDLALAPFLGFLARDIAAHPEHVLAVDPGLVGQQGTQQLGVTAGSQVGDAAGQAHHISAQALVEGVEVELDAPLSADDE